MYVLGILDSSNYTVNLYKLLREKGYSDIYVEPIPCKIAKSGCGYCLKMPIEHMNEIIQLAKQNNIIIREAYKIIDSSYKTYEKIL